MQVKGCLNLMSLAMNVLYQHSLLQYITERDGRIVVQTPSFQQRYPVRLFLGLTYNTYTSSSPLAFNIMLCAYN